MAQATAKATLMLDYNGDGRPDLLHPDVDGEWALSIGVMSDELLFAGPYPLQRQLRCVGPSSIADFNGDGRSDILQACPVAAGTGEFSVLLATGDLGNPFTPIFVAGQGHDTAVAIDINADGESEVITCTPTRGFPHDPPSFSFQNTGGSTAPAFAQVGILPARTGSIPWCVGKGYINDPNYREPALALDLDADGAPNLVGPGFTSQVGAAAWQYLSVGAGFAMEWRAADVQGHDSWPLPLRVLDVQGDGLPDQLVNVPFNPVSGDGLSPQSIDGRPPLGFGYRATVHLNRLHGGASLIPAYFPRVEEGSTTVTDVHDPLGYGLTLDAFATLRVIDFDRDGRDEFIGLVKVGSGYQWYLFVDEAPNNTQPSFIKYRAEPMGLSVTHGLTNNGMAPMITDLDGDRVPDLLLYSFETSRLRLHRGYQPERYLLREVRDGLGNRIEVNYSNHLTSGVYVASTDCGPHARCLGTTGPLVRMVTSRDAQDRVDGSTAFAYADGRIGKYGRGPLGFGVRAMSEFDGASRLMKTVVEEYENGQTFDPGNKSFPLAGMLVRSTTTTAAVVNGIGASEPELPRTRWKTIVHHEYAMKLSDAGRPFVVPTLTVTDQYQELEGQDLLLLRNIVSRPASGYDAYGNQTHMEAIALDGDGSEVDRTRTLNSFYPRGQ